MNKSKKGGQKKDDESAITNKDELHAMPMGKTTDKGRRVAETGDGRRERVTTRQGSSMSQRQTASLGSGVMETARLQAAT